MRNSKLIIEDLISRDTNKVWLASCEIIQNGQDRNSILPLIKYLSEIKETTHGLNMGGLLAPKQRFVDFAIRIIEFHKSNKQCSCILYEEYEMFNPKAEQEKGNIRIIEAEMLDENYPDHYIAECLNCGQKFKITEHEYHFTWWKWEVIS